MPSSSRARRATLVLALAATLAGLGGFAEADVVTRRDGRTVEGVVVSVDADHVLVRTDRGNVSIPRGRVEAIRFGAVEAAAPPVRVEIRVIEADDAIDVHLGDEDLVTDARGRGSWIDITDRLNDGNNELRLTIENERASWSFRVHLRLNGEVVPVACSDRSTSDGRCTCCGYDGLERGAIELPSVWVAVDRGLGLAEVAPWP